MIDRLVPIFLLILCSLVLASCARFRAEKRMPFSVNEDVQLGQQVARRVDSTFRAQGQLLERTSSEPQVQRAYAHLDRIINRLLNAGTIAHRDDFRWESKIIQDPSVVNAFVVPGGYLYVYSGWIQALESEDQFAGALSHEVAYSDRRHAMRLVQRQYGVRQIRSLLQGENPKSFSVIAGQLAGQREGLRFSREEERKADKLSVVYLAVTAHYACDGAAGFFEQILSRELGSSQPGFLRAHPSPESQARSIQELAQTLGCSTTPVADTRFLDFQETLGLIQ